jgi:hypothetical protein
MRRPSRAIWVAFTEQEHGQQTVAGFTFTSDQRVTARLASFTAA